MPGMWKNSKPICAAIIGALALAGCGDDGGGGKPATLDPVRGEFVVLEAQRGTVKVRMPGEPSQRLRGRERLPAGTLVNAIRGVVTLEAIGPRGTQRASFYEGAFRIELDTADGAVETRLVGGDLSKCRTPGRSGARRPVRKLFGDGKGDFRTSGRFGAATVRGTVWVVRDFCEGTQIGVRRGKVDATNLATNDVVVLASATERPHTVFFAAGAPGSSDD